MFKWFRSRTKKPEATEETVEEYESDDIEIVPREIQEYVEQLESHVDRLEETLNEMGEEISKYSKSRNIKILKEASDKLDEEKKQASNVLISAALTFILLENIVTTDEHRRGTTFMLKEPDQSYFKLRILKNDDNLMVIKVEDNSRFSVTHYGVPKGHPANGIFESIIHIYNEKDNIQSINRLTMKIRDHIEVALNMNKEPEDSEGSV